jgi:hypothetical protein
MAVNKRRVCHNLLCRVAHIVIMILTLATLTHHVGVSHTLVLLLAILIAVEQFRHRFDEPLSVKLILRRFVFLLFAC